MLKRIFSILLVLVLVITMTSCAGADKSLEWKIEDGVLTVNADESIGYFHGGFSAIKNDCYREDLIPWFGESFHTVVIGEDITDIGNHSFTHSEELEKVIILGENVKVPECAFCDCENLKEIENMDSIVEIGMNAFYGCSSLTSISFGEKTTCISMGAFENCYNLKEVYISASVKEIDNEAFNGCTSLEKFVVDENNPYYTSVDGVIYSKHKEKLILYPTGKKDQSFVVPEEVELITEFAFNEPANLKEVTIYNASTESSAFFYCNALETVKIEGKSDVGTSAFFGCENFVEFDVDEQNKYHVAVDGVLFSYDMKELLSYPSGKNDATYTIPEEVVKIKKSAFEENNHIQNIIFESSGVTVIDECTFCGCNNLKSISLPDSLTTIENSAFNGCESMISIKIPDGVTMIGEDAFRRCESLTSIVIPDSVISIGEYAFAGIDDLTIICSENSVAHDHAKNNNITFELQ